MDPNCVFVSSLTELIHSSSAYADFVNKTFWSSCGAISVINVLVSDHFIVSSCVHIVL